MGAMNAKKQDILWFFLILAVVFALYHGFEKNYFFSDDFQWLAQGIRVNDSPAELFQVRGRDFNPLLALLTWALLKIGGLNPLVFRLLNLLVFGLALFLFYILLYRYFQVNRLIALCFTFLFGFNVYISEVMLYFSTFVYPLTLVFFLLAVMFYLDGKKMLYLLMLLLAFQVKETILLGLIPLFLYEKKGKNRVFLLLSGGIILLTRLVFQLGAGGSYTGFVSRENFFYKIYFLLVQAINLSPFSFSFYIGLALVLLLAVIFLFYLRRQRPALFFGSFLVVFTLFFAFLPRLSSKYYFYPSFALFGLAALLCHHFYGQRPKLIRYLLLGLLALSLGLNYPAIRGEIGDYRILGDFSRAFVQEQGRIITGKADFNRSPVETRIDQVSQAPLASVFRRVNERQNLLKLLPSRKNSLGGVIIPGDLVPIAFYPQRIVRWQPVSNTPAYFQGLLVSNQRPDIETHEE